MLTVLEDLLDRFILGAVMECVTSLGSPTKRRHGMELVSNNDGLSRPEEPMCVGYTQGEAGAKARAGSGIKMSVSSSNCSVHHGAKPKWLNGPCREPRFNGQSRSIARSPERWCSVGRPLICVFSKDLKGYDAYLSFKHV